MTNRKIYRVIAVLAIGAVGFFWASIEALSSANYRLLTYAYLSARNDSSVVLSFPVPRFLLDMYWEKYSREELFFEQLGDGDGFLFVVGIIDGQSNQVDIHIDEARAEALAGNLLCLTASREKIAHYNELAGKLNIAFLKREMNLYSNGGDAYCGKNK